MLIPLACHLRSPVEKRLLEVYPCRIEARPHLGEIAFERGQQETYTDPVALDQIECR